MKRQDLICGRKFTGEIWPLLEWSVSVSNVVHFPKLVSGFLTDRDGSLGGQQVSGEASSAISALQGLEEQLHSHENAGGLGIVTQMDVEYLGVYRNGSFFGVWQFSEEVFLWIPASYLTAQFRCNGVECAVEFTLRVVAQQLRKA